MVNETTPQESEEPLAATKEYLKDSIRWAKEDLVIANRKNRELKAKNLEIKQAKLKIEAEKAKLEAEKSKLEDEISELEATVARLTADLEERGVISMF